MATSNGKTPKHGGSHFGSGSKPVAQSGAKAPLSVAGAKAPRSALSNGRVSGRTAAATRRAGRGEVIRDGAPTSHSRTVGIVAAALAVVVLLGIVAVAILPSLNNPSEAESDTQEIVAGNQVSVLIPEGSGAAAVADILFEDGVIASKSEFLAQARRMEAESSLMSGSYNLVTGADLADIVTQLTTGPNDTSGKFTIPEGYTLAQIADVVEETLGIPAADFTSQAKASAYVADYPFLADVDPSYDTLEGYLFPKTYDFSSEAEVTADTVIRAMLDQYQTEVSAINFDDAIALIKDRYGIDVNEDDIITMASIVEREAGGDEHRADVASVLYNRLEIGMALQSDATLVYSLGREVTPEDLQVDEPYNTYTRPGLTPTPICSPGIASIEAAANPAQTSYLYFFLSGDYAAFSETLDEHNQAIANRPQ